MASTKRIGADFTNGSILKQLIKFMFPFLLANVLTNIYNTVDMIVIGQFEGSAGTVAVSMGGKLLTIITQMSMNLAAGGQIIISQQAGAGKSEQLKRTIGTSFTFSVFISVMFAVVSVCFSRSLLNLLNTPGEAMEGAMQYCVITGYGLPLIIGYNVISSVLRGMGDSKHPLMFIAIASVINLVLDYLFIGPLGMSAAGGALATVIAQGVSFIVSLCLLIKRREEFGFDFKLRSFKVDFPILGKMMRIGLPMALNGMFIHVTQLVVVGYVNLCGVTAAAAFNIGDKIVRFANIYTNSIYQAGATIAGQNIGARLPERAKETVKASLKLSLTACVILSVISVALPELLFSIFTTDAAVISFAKSFMYVSVGIYILAALNGSYELITVATGNAKLSFLGGFMDGVVLRLSLCWLLGSYLGFGVVGYFVGTAYARIGPILVHGIYYYSGKWETYRTLTD